jgi:cullin-associated NEDD8-dissociated protein 1
MLRFACPGTGEAQLFSPHNAGDGPACATTIPMDGATYEMEMVDLGPNHTADARATAARFLGRTTFGPTATELDSFVGLAAHLEEQMALTPSSHRAYVRWRTNPRFPRGYSHHMPTGHLRSPCAAGSRWTRFALTEEDVGKALATNGSFITVDGAIRTGGSFPAVLKSDLLFVEEKKTFDDARAHCQALHRDLAVPSTAADIEEFLDHNHGTWSGWIGVTDAAEEGVWRSVNGSNDTDLFLPWMPGEPNNVRGEHCAELRSSGKLNDMRCNSRLTFYCGPRTGASAVTLDKVLAAPLVVCSVQEVVGGEVTFGTDCLGSLPNPAVAGIPASSSRVVVTSGRMVKLEPESVVGGAVLLAAAVSEAPCASAPVHGPLYALVDGLHYVADGRMQLLENTVEAPAVEPVTTTRALRSECPNVAKTFLNAHTCVVGRESCSKISFSHANVTLDAATLRAFYKESGKLVLAVTGLGEGHEDEGKVFDFTHYALTHPLIGARASAGETTLPWTSDFADFRGKWAWEGTRDKKQNQIAALGMLGHTVDFADLPLGVQSEGIARFVGAEDSRRDASYESCGSPGEVANEPELGHHYFMMMGEPGSEPGDAEGKRDRIRAAKFRKQEGPETAWLNVALRSPDQLRQRMAWALSQIFVVSKTGVNKASSTELWANYYDIFVRNAFGNYRDVMREVSYSPVMATMLTYLNSRSIGQTGFFPDENFAREVMQLFSIGLWQLNANGTRVENAQGHHVPSYTMQNIESLARAWTGFRTQNTRFNYEHKTDRFEYNMIDPMRIHEEWRDQEPKLDLRAGFVGDGYPMCADLPERGFLRKGALFRYIGSSGLPDKSVDPDEYLYEYEYGENSKNKRINITRVNLRAGTSALHAALCNATSEGECRFRSEVVLAHDLQCDGVECNLDMANVVQLPNAAKDSKGRSYHVRFEYVRPACVEMAFPEQPTLMLPQGGTRWLSNAKPMCADTRSALGQVACCSTTMTSPWEPMIPRNGVQLLTKANATCSPECSAAVTGLWRWRVKVQKNAMQDKQGSGYDTSLKLKIVGSNGNEFPIFRVNHFAWAKQWFYFQPVSSNAQYSPGLLDKFNALFPPGTNLTVQQRSVHLEDVNNAYCASAYSNEKVRLATAKARCEARGMQLCDFKIIHPPKGTTGWSRGGGGCEIRHKSAYFWSTGARTCRLQAQVNMDGLISIVDNITGSVDIENPVVTALYQADSLRRFRAVWDTAFPTVAKGCGSCAVHGDTCLCDASVQVEAVFTATAPSRAQVLARLKVGSFAPDAFDSGAFLSRRIGDVIAHTPVAHKGVGLTADTVFEVVAGDSRAEKRYFKNTRSTVLLGGGTYRFRNPPVFHARGHPTIRDAEYETEAVLDQYFEHQSVPPFVAGLLIQRFVTSNPSPRYVEVVSTAFSRGRYKGFGTGQRGDLAATIAAVLLDREATSDVLGSADGHIGAVREPLLKYLHLMRSLDFKSAIGAQEVVLASKLGQYPYQAESVFNFFQYDYRSPGAVTAAGLVAPEAILLTSVDILGFVNGAHSLIRWGLTSCDKGLGLISASRGCTSDVYDSNAERWRNTAGNLTFATAFSQDVATTGRQAVRELDLLLTGARLSARQRGIVEDAFAAELNPPFRWIKKTMTWADARAHCLAIGRDLASIHSQADLDAIVTLKPHSNAQGWVGVTDANTEQTWVNVDNTSAFDGWRRRDTDGKVIEGKGSESAHGGNGEDCAFFNKHGSLSDHHCEHGLQFVCGKKVRAFTASELASATAVAQALIVATPEFHVSGSTGATAQVRPAPEPKANSNAADRRLSYKAIVYLALNGGADSFNMLVPHSECSAARDLYAQYHEVRGNVALQKGELLPIDVVNGTGKGQQVCRKFGLHPKLKTVQQLYQAGDALWIANAGTLVEPMTRHTFKTGRKPVQLFGHKQQTRLAQNGQADSRSRTDGVLGRMAKQFQDAGHGVGSYSISGQQATIITPPPGVKFFDVVGSGGVPTLSSDSKPLLPAMAALMANVSASPFAETWSATLNSTLNSTAQLGDLLENVELRTPFVTGENQLSRQLQQVARLVRANAETLHNERDVFYVSLGGFDSHSMVESQMEESLALVDEAVALFAAEMKAQGLWDSVAIVQSSEFGRTLSSNGDGTDHAWGGNYFMAGGAVKGGQIVGRYPDDLSPEGDQILHRGRVVPSTPWEAVWAGVGEWFGVEEAALTTTVLPNYGNFPEHFSRDDLFLPPPTTASPTATPTGTPTAPPTALDAMENFLREQGQI